MVNPKRRAASALHKLVRERPPISYMMKTLDEYMANSIGGGSNDRVIAILGGTLIEGQRNTGRLY